MLSVPGEGKLHNHGSRQKCLLLYQRTSPVIPMARKYRSMFFNRASFYCKSRPNPVRITRVFRAAPSTLPRNPMPWPWLRNTFRRQGKGHVRVNPAWLARPWLANTD